MKIIDFERKGNLVRFYLGDDNLTEWYGDDWDDTPYECNAGEVYDEYVKGYRDVVFPFEDLVLEPSSGTCNSGWCKDDMRGRRVPCIIHVPEKVYDYSWNDSFDRWIGSADVHKYYFGDQMEPERRKDSLKWITPIAILIQKKMNLSFIKPITKVTSKVFWIQAV